MSVEYDLNYKGSTFSRVNFTFQVKVMYHLWEVDPIYLGPLNSHSKLGKAADHSEKRPRFKLRSERCSEERHTPSPPRRSPPSKLRSERSPSRGKGKGKGRVWNRSRRRLDDHEFLGIFSKLVRFYWFFLEISCNLVIVVLVVSLSMVYCWNFMLNLVCCSHWRDQMFLFFSAGDITSQCFAIFTPGFSASLKMPPKRGSHQGSHLPTHPFYRDHTWCWTTLVGGSHTRI